MFGLFGNKKPAEQEKVYIENDLGKFLVRTFGKTTPMLEGDVEWPDSDSVEVNMICDENDASVQDKNFEYFRKILENKDELNDKLFPYIVEQHTEDDGMVHIWGDEDMEGEPITPEEFGSRLFLSYIRIYADSTSEFVFPADGLFTDHDIVVRVDNDLNITECVLEG